MIGSMMNGRPCSHDVKTVNRRLVVLAACHQVGDIGWISFDARPKMMMIMMMMMMMMIMMMLWLSSIHGSIMPLQDRKKRMLIDRDREI